MKFCYQCGRLTAGDPLYCSSCGRTYDVKLCPRHHQNSRSAEACSQCGSRELSTPQPKVPVRWRILAFVTKVVLAVCLVAITLVFIKGMLAQMAFSPELQTGVTVLAILLGLLWWMWSQLPMWFREAIQKWLIKSREGRER